MLWSEIGLDDYVRLIKCSRILNSLFAYTQIQFLFNFVLPMLSVRNAFAWKESGKPQRKNHPSSPERDLNLDLTILSGLAQDETSALDKYASENHLNTCSLSHTMRGGNTNQQKECVRGLFQMDGKHIRTNLQAVELVRKSGYPCEEHLVVTEDGYILTVHRIPIGRVPSNQINLRPPVLLMHGLLATSDCWMLTPPEQTLAFLLADSGYDIWLANVRGNYYSQKHTKLSTNQSEYWNFSFHEMGLYDLSATINYILSVTGEKRLFYIGISMGTTIFYVLASSRPEYNSKIRAMFSLGPAAYYGTLRLPLFKFVKSRTSLVLKILSMIGSYGLLPRIRLTADIAEKYCGDGSQTQDQCTQLFALVSGEPLDKINKTAIPFYISHFFSGTSRKTLAHYSQNIASEEFQLYDYKYGGNVMNYGMTKPPKYNLSLITAPVALHYSQDDQLVHPNNLPKGFGILAKWKNNSNGATRSTRNFVSRRKRVRPSQLVFSKLFYKLRCEGSNLVLQAVREALQHRERSNFTG
uniref:Partial AB-hydrolase lipase domain-containing protein n=1 Tax=Timema cristinae TaxID=61476 RepID=A0A7R9GRK6_TIMCR|nr:unnamed protein product [Timema cristinae]